METNIKYKEALEAYIDMTPQEHNEIVFKAGKLYLEHHFNGIPSVVSKWINTHSFWTWFTTQWNMKCRETYEILMRANIGPNKAAKIFGNKNFEILAMYPAQPVIENIQLELQEMELQDLLKGTGVRLRKETNYITKTQQP